MSETQTDTLPGYVELPRLSATRYGPIPPSMWLRLRVRPDAIEMVRDAPENALFSIMRGEYTVEWDRVVAFHAPQLSFACRCLTERIIELLVPEVVNTEEVEVFFAEGGDLVVRWEAAHPGTLPHVGRAFTGSSAVKRRPRDGSPPDRPLRLSALPPHALARGPSS